MTTPQTSDGNDKGQPLAAEGLGGALQREVAPLLEHTRRTVLETTEELLRSQTDLLVGRLKGMLLETAAELQERQLEPLLDRVKHTVLAVCAEVGQKYGATLLSGVRDALGEGVGGVLRQQLEPVVEQARRGMRDSTDFVGEYADLLVARMRDAVTEPIARVLREDLPNYARRAGGRVVDYALAATLFCLAAVFLLVGAVQGLQYAGLPSYLTYLLGGLAALGTGLVFLRLYARPLQTPGATGDEPRSGRAEKPPP